MPNTQSSCISHYGRSVKRKRCDPSPMKTKNSDYWAPAIAAELLTVMNICWYIKYEMFRSKRLPSPYNSSIEQMKKLPPTIESDILTKSRMIFNDLYRSNLGSRVCLVHPDPTKMKRGSILHYDKSLKKYAVVFNDSKEKVVMIEPANLMCLDAPKSYRPSVRQVDTCSVEIDNKFDTYTDTHPWRVNYERQLMRTLEAISGGQNFPNEKSYSFYCSEMPKRDERERLIKLKAENNLVQHRANLRDMKRKLEVQTETNKARRRALSNRSTAEKYESVVELLHSNTIDLKKCPPKQNPSSEDVDFVPFGFPFKTTDKSLGDVFGIMDGLLGRESKLFCSGHVHLNEETILNHFRRDVQLISPASIESLEPGHCLGDEIVNLFLQM